MPVAPKPATPSQTAKAPDGDYLAPGSGRASVKDADGDYKPTASTQAKSAPAVQAALPGLKLGGTSAS
jgi:hypothetical protein